MGDRTSTAGAKTRSEPSREEDLRVLGLGGGTPEPSRKLPPSRRKFWIALTVAGVLLLGGLVRRALRPPLVELAAVSMREFGMPPALLTAAGYAIAKRQIIVSSKAQGKIVQLLADENQQVKEGQVIARLDDQEQRSNLRLAKAELDQAEMDLARMAPLVQEVVASKADWDRTQTAFEVAKSRFELAQVALDNTVIRAPFDGTIIRKIRDVGEFLTIGVTASGDPGTAVVTLADLSEMSVELEINETEISKVRLNGPALVTAEALPERRYLADVSHVGAMADRQKSIVKVKVRLRSSDADLKPDMTAKVSFLEKEPEGKIEVIRSLPESSVVERDGKKAVFTVEEGRAVLKTIEARPSGDGHWILKDGPPEGTFVIKAPPTDLENGDKVATGRE
ncbi:MAG: efflux RND transporter periplasmic adaptor subunit [Bdellovibrionota bacterium]